MAYNQWNIAEPIHLCALVILVLLKHMFLASQIHFFVVPDTVQTYADLQEKNCIFSDILKIFHLSSLLYFLD